MIERPLYLDKLFAWKDKDVIKVITPGTNTNDLAPSCSITSLTIAN